MTAIGLAAAALLGAAGAVGGAKAAGKLEEKTEEGLPKDEIYLYEDALAHGRSIVFVLADSTEQAQAARQALEQAGAESLDAAAESWWVGVETRKGTLQEGRRHFATHEITIDTASSRPSIECRGKPLRHTARGSGTLPREPSRRLPGRLRARRARARDVRVLRPRRRSGSDK